MDRVGRGALRAQGFQLLFECAQFTNARGHVVDVLVEQFIDIPAVFQRGIFEPQQCADFVECHVEVAAMADESQPLHMLSGVGAVVVLRALCRRQQTLSLVETNGLNRDTGDFGKRAYANFGKPVKWTMP